MRCPRCSSQAIFVFRSPVVDGQTTYRRHRCRDCGHTFLSVQRVLESEAEMERLADLLER